MPSSLRGERVQKEGKPVYATRFSRILTSLVAVCLVCLFIACAPLVHASASNTASQSHSLHPALSTNCPSPGTARAASIPSITLGSHPTIVYIVNEGTSSQPTFGTLKRYDVTTGNKVEILKMSGASISE